MTLEIKDDRLELQTATNKMLLQKMEDNRRAKSVAVEPLKTQQKFRRTAQDKNKTLREDMPVEKIYGQAEQFIKNFDTSIVKCKRFNEMKTYRKYEVIMRDMQLQIIKLKDKLQMEEQMKSPTKQYMSEVLNKLVEYKSDNQRLRKELEEANKTIKTQQTEINNQKNGICRLENSVRAKATKFPPLQQSVVSNTESVQPPIKAFLDHKTQQNQQLGLPSSKLQGFLKDVWVHLWQWDLTHLLIELDKFIEQVPQKSHVDMWKIRMGVAKKMNSIIDLSSSRNHQSSVSNLSMSEVPTYRTDLNPQVNAPAHWSLHKRGRRH